MGSMNKIISFDKVSSVLVCEAGCILENLVSFLDNQGFIMPLDLGAKGSCQIGGNVSTNAGGLRLYGMGRFMGLYLVRNLDAFPFGEFLVSNYCRSSFCMLVCESVSIQYCQRSLNMSVWYVFYFSVCEQ